MSQCTLSIKNSINCQVLAEVMIDTERTHLDLQKNGEAEVKFKNKPEYTESYEMIEKYKRVLVKLTIVQMEFGSRSPEFSVFLHKQAYNYLPVIFEDCAGNEVGSAVGLRVHQQGNLSNYILEIVSAFKIVNSTIRSIWISEARRDEGNQRK
jgi:hypothetical protein